MSEVRRDQRYYIQDKDHYLVKVEANGGKIVNCFLNDISASGACIILDKEVFLQRDKEYPFEILEKRNSGVLEKIASANGKIVWYLSKEFQEKDMLFLGIEFQEKIRLPESIFSKEGKS